MNVSTNSSIEIEEDSSESSIRTKALNGSYLTASVWQRTSTNSSLVIVRSSESEKKTL